MALERAADAGRLVYEPKQACLFLNRASYCAS
jgi:hypothetical protein